MKFALPSSLLLVLFFCIQLFLEHMSVEAAVTCSLDGRCRDTKSIGRGTVCGRCKSCTFKNCCNKVYKSPYAHCKQKGWRAKDYKGNVPVDISASRKRAAGCTGRKDCPSGYRCIAYNRGDPRGFCWRETFDGPKGNSWFALAIGIAGLAILL